MVWKDEGGEIFADGPDGQIDSGSDFSTVAQNAYDYLGENGVLLFYPDSYTFTDSLVVDRHHSVVDGLGSLFEPSTGFSGFFIDSKYTSDTGSGSELDWGSAQNYTTLRNMFIKGTCRGIRLDRQNYCSYYNLFFESTDQALKIDTNVRNSNFYNIKTYNCGSLSYPVVEIQPEYSHTRDANNDLRFDQFSIIFPKANKAMRIATDTSLNTSDRPVCRNIWFKNGQWHKQNPDDILVELLGVKRISFDNINFRVGSPCLINPNTAPSGESCKNIRVVNSDFAIGTGNDIIIDDCETLTLLNNYFENSTMEEAIVNNSNCRLLGGGNLARDQRIVWLPDVPEGRVHLRDTFDDDTLSRYYTQELGTWTVTGGHVESADTTGRQTLVLNEYELGEGIYKVSGYFPSGATNIQEFRFLFGWQDDNNKYLFKVHEVNDEIYLQKFVGGTITTLWSTAKTINTDTWYDVEVRWTPKAGVFELLFNGSYETSITGQTDFSSGKVGLEVYSSQVYFDDLEVYARPEVRELAP